MVTQVETKKEYKTLQPLLKEMKEIKYYLKKLLIIIPEESLKEYKNSSEIKKTYLKTLKSFPSSKK